MRLKINLLLLAVCISFFMGAQTYDSLLVNEKLPSIIEELESFDGTKLEREIIFGNRDGLEKLLNIADRVALKLWINRMGTVTFVELIADDTTIKDKNVLRKFMKASRAYKFTPKQRSKKEECFRLVFSMNEN